MQGWLKLYRQLAENSIWLLKPFSEGQAWVDLLMITTFDSGFIKTKNGTIIKLNRGQCGFSQLTLSERWGWSRGKVNRYLKLLESEKMIQQKIVANTTIINIINYDNFQNDTINNTINDTINGQQTIQQTDTIKNDNNDKNEKNDKYTHTTSEEMQANDKLASIDFIHTKDYQFIKAVYQQVYGLKLARLSSEQLSVVRSWFEIVDNPTKIQLVLDYYKNEYTWDGGKKPSANWIFKSSTNFINVYDDMVQKRGSTFSMLKEG